MTTITSTKPVLRKNQKRTGVDTLRTIRLKPARGVELSIEKPHTCVVRAYGWTRKFRFQDDFVPGILRVITTHGLLLGDLRDAVADAPQGAFLDDQVARLWRSGLLSQEINYGDLCATLHAGGTTPLFPPAVSAVLPTSLTEDVCIRMQGDAVLLESAKYSAVVELRDRRCLGLLMNLMTSAHCADVVESTDLPAEVAFGVVGWLIGMEAASQETDTNRVPTTWSFADRLLHARSRMGTHVGGYGGTFRLRDKLPEPPALRERRSTERIRLPKPDLTSVAAADPPLTAVIENRVSIRQHAADPLSAAELGEFLYRCLRVRQQSTRSDAPSLSRPYPAAGGLYELEFYPIVNRCNGVPRGLYRYDGVAHELEWVAAISRESQLMMEAAQTIARSQGGLQILIVVAARFARVAWKYESIAYSCVLKDVGVVYQTMYLVATAMGLAPCALGGGDSTLFSRAANMPYWEEGSVGEFLLGRRVSGTS